MSGFCPEALSHALSDVKLRHETLNFSRECGGDVRIIATIEDPVVIRKILANLDEKAVTAVTAQLPPCRAPPVTGLFD